MKLVLFGENRLTKLILPEKADGSFWIEDEKCKNLINVESVSNNWVIKSNDEVKLIKNNSYISSDILVSNTFYYVEKEKKQILLYVENSRDDSIGYYSVQNGFTINVGFSQNSHIVFVQDALDLPKQFPCRSAPLQSQGRSNRSRRI